jgi:hypothetical protein
MTTTPPAPDHDALEREMTSIADDLDGASIIGVIMTVADYLEIDAREHLREGADHTSEGRLLRDLIEQSQSRGDAHELIMRAIEIEEIMLSLED